MRSNELITYVFYDSLEVWDLIKQVLGVHFKEVHAIHTEELEEKIVGYLSKEHYSALHLYAFDDPQDATDFMKLLEEHPSLAQLKKVPHQSVLLCDKTHRERAFILCENDLFYTYETIKPIYDINKVRLTLKRLAQYIENQAELYYSMEENLSMAGSIYQSNEAMDDIETSLVATREAQEQELGSMIASLGTLVDNLSTDEWRALLNSINHSLSKSSELIFPVEALKPGLEQYQRDNHASIEALIHSLESSRPKIVSHKPVVLVADDQPVMLKIIATVLEPRGYKVESAVNGVEALLKAKVILPALILLDIDMPTMDGIAALKALKKLPQLCSIPVVMLTSYSDKNMVEECIADGAVDYIVKPTSADVILKKVTRALDG